MKQIIPFVKDITFNTRVSEITSISLEHNLNLENNDSIVGTFLISGKYKINDISINEESFDEKVPFDITLDDKYDASKLEIDIDDFYYEIINEEILRVHIDVLADNLVYYKKENDTREIDAKIDDVTNDTVNEFIPNEDVKEESNETTEENTIENNDEEVVETTLVEEQRKEENNLIEEKNKVITPMEEVIQTPKDNKNEETLLNEDKGKVRENIAMNLGTNFLSETEKYSMYKVHIIRENETVETIKEMYNITTEELEKYNSLDKILLGSKIIIPINDEQKSN